MTEWIQNLGWPNQLEFITMLGMLAATYSTRVIGWLILRNREVSPRFEAVLKASWAWRSSWSEGRRAGPRGRDCGGLGGS